MVEAILFVINGSLLTVSIATLVVAFLTLRDARRSVDLAEVCREYLREERARLLGFPTEEPEQAERRETRVPSPLTVGATAGLSGEAREAGGPPRSTSPPRKTGWEAPEGSMENKKPRRRGVWHPHPDDGDGRGRAPMKQESVGSETPIEMFRKHYDKYLENYQGYVELAERLRRMRDNGEVPPGSPKEHEWEKKLKRVNHGMDRTTARLDILEEHNPELATDDRISRRAGLARRRADLERSQRDRKRT